MEGIDIRGGLTDTVARVCSPEALAFVRDLHRELDPERRRLLARRQERWRELREGATPDFLAETEDVRAGDWHVEPPPADLLDRRVEITGPVERKMVINALNSGASVFMADFEDANCPTWTNNLDGHVNLMDAVRRTITFTSPEGKHYAPPNVNSCRDNPVSGSTYRRAELAPALAVRRSP